MDHLTLRYYDAEMRYLREAAKEFAQTHPDRAAMLDLDKAGTLALYNWQEDELNTRRLEAIQQVAHHRLQRFEQGYLLRGLDIEVTLDSNGFTGEGDIHLFGEMLNRFFALYADMNQFNQLTLIVQPEGKCIRWKENHSPRLPG